MLLPRQIDVCRDKFLSCHFIPASVWLTGRFGLFFPPAPRFLCLWGIFTTSAGRFGLFFPPTPRFLCLRGVLASFAPLRPALPARHNRKSHPYKFLVFCIFSPSSCPSDKKHPSLKELGQFIFAGINFPCILILCPTTASIT